MPHGEAHVVRQPADGYTYFNEFRDRMQREIAFKPAVEGERECLCPGVSVSKYVRVHIPTCLAPGNWIHFYLLRGKSRVDIGESCHSRTDQLDSVVGSYYECSGQCHGVFIDGFSCAEGPKHEWITKTEVIIQSDKYLLT